MVSVNKGKWDRSMGFEENYRFTREWLAACQRVLKPNGSVWISGTSHIIHIVGCCLDELGYKILNDITWVKPNPPPNLSCRYFTHATETIIWAGRDKKCRHTFNYPLMKRVNGGKQMTSVWSIDAPRREEKTFGKPSRLVGDTGPQRSPTAKGILPLLSRILTSPKLARRRAPGGDPCLYRRTAPSHQRTQSARGWDSPRIGQPIDRPGGTAKDGCQFANAEHFRQALGTTVLCSFHVVSNAREYWCIGLPMLR